MREVFGKLLSSPSASYDMFHALALGGFGLFGLGIVVFIGLSVLSAFKLGDFQTWSGTYAAGLAALGGTWGAAMMATGGALKIRGSSSVGGDNHDGNSQGERGQGA